MNNIGFTTPSRVYRIANGYKVEGFEPGLFKRFRYEMMRFVQAMNVLFEKAYGLLLLAFVLYMIFEVLNGLGLIQFIIRQW